jgi:two-component system NtrC family sensor kinase
VAGERILVIDDSPRIRSVLRQAFLEPEGYTVLTAHDGQEGLERALQEHPDLILLDVYMPRMTGLEVLQKLHEAQYEWPVILMTSHGSEETAVQAFRLGVRDYLRKPFKIEEVLARVRRTLVESQLRRDRDQLLKRLEATNRQLGRRVNDLITLYAIGQAVTSLLDLDNMLSRVVEASVYVCQADEGVLYLADQETGELYMTAAQSLGERAQQGLRLRVVDRLADRVLRTGKPIDDMGRLTAIANYAAIAAENARLLEATRETAIAEMLNNTVVTVSHYINTPLMALMMKADRLVQAQRDGTLAESEELAIEMARFTEMKVKEIEAVLTILRDLVSPQVVTYIDNIKMLDIEAKVRERLARIKLQYQG